MLTDQQYSDLADEAVNAARVGIERLIAVCDAVRPLVPAAEADWPDFLARSEKTMSDLDDLRAAYAAGEVNHGSVVFPSRQVAQQAEQLADKVWLKYFDVEEN